MDKRNFKKIFNQVAQNNGFLFQSPFWYKESDDCIVTLDLSKSNYSNLFYLTIKIFIKKAFKGWAVNKELHNAWPESLRRLPSEFNTYLDLEQQHTQEQGKEGIEQMFNKFITPFVKDALTLSGIQSLFKSKQLHLDDVVSERINKLLKDE